MTETAEQLLAEIWELGLADRLEIREELLKSLATQDPKYAAAHQEAVKARLEREASENATRSKA